ncbi:MAG: hypothetical protein HZA90_14750 [Verrucomicrobia bacterium]|nr:hypothetical protein [Verrucomicrobiota bacterium]
MKTNLLRILGLAVLFSLELPAAPLGTAFTYQGNLTDGGAPASGSYELTFQLFNDSLTGSPASNLLTNRVQVSGGLFTAVLDFGSAPFEGAAVWLEIGVRTNGSAGAFSLLAPRQPLTPAPQALYATKAGTATNLSAALSASQLAGTVPDANLPANLARTNHDHYGQSWTGGGFYGLRVFNSADGPNVGLLGSAQGIGSRGVQGQNNGGGTGVEGLSPDGAGVLGQSTTGHFFVGRTGLGEQRFWVTADGTVRAKGGFQGDGAGLSNVVALSLAPSAWSGLWPHGIHLSAADEPMIVRDWDVFDPSAPGGKAGIGRWGLFMEPHRLTLGLPGDDLPGKLLQVAKYAPDGTPTPLMTVDQAGVVTATRFQTPSGLQFGDEVLPSLNVTNADTFDVRLQNDIALRLERAWSGNLFSSEQSINVRAGYPGNTIAGGCVGATVAGGGSLFSDVVFGSVSNPNQVSGSYGTVSGGYGNSAGEAGTVAGGYNNTAGANSAVGGGHHNLASANGVVAGGHHNTARSEGAVPGGSNNEAAGVGSLAAGRDAHAAHDGSFVWSDGAGARYSTKAESFDVAAHGGARFYIGDEGFWIANNKGIGLDALDAPLITRGWDTFNSSAGSKAGLGRWGLFMEPGQLVAGIPAEDVGPRTFAVGKYNVDGSYQSLLTVQQNGDLSCNSVTILGGADLAEPFAMTEQDVAAGSVVVIDKTSPGRLQLSRSAYDRKVAGVVSGANGIKAGISMVQENALEAGRNVALSGRVYVLADAQFGAIKPGDLLTTSDTPGHARKVTDHAKAQGAILGKAMSVLPEGRGMVLVLVTLQ